MFLIKITEKHHHKYLNIIYYREIMRRNVGIGAIQQQMLEKVCRDFIKTTFFITDDFFIGEVQ